MTKAFDNFRIKKRWGKFIQFAGPDFLWRLVALADFMRLSLRKGAHAAAPGAAWQQIRATVQSMLPA